MISITSLERKLSLSIKVERKWGFLYYNIGDLHPLNFSDDMGGEHDTEINDEESDNVSEIQGDVPGGVTGVL